MAESHPPGGRTGVIATIAAVVLVLGCCALPLLLVAGVISAGVMSGSIVVLAIAVVVALGIWAWTRRHARA